MNITLAQSKTHPKKRNNYEKKFATKPYSKREKLIRAYSEFQSHFR